MLKSIITAKVFEIENNFHTLLVKGPDSQDFLNRQLTNNVNDLSLGSFQLNARLDRSGRVHSFFYLLKIAENEFEILVDPLLKEKVLDELSKFLITEDVTITSIDTSSYIYVGLSLFSNDNKSACSGEIYKMPALITKEKLAYDKMDKAHEEILMTLSAWPILGKTIELGNLVNESILNELAVSYKKGCFLGQETAAKIHTRRGAARYPTWLVSKNNLLSDLDFKTYQSVHVDGNYYTLAELPRELRVQDRSIEIKSQDVMVKMFSPLGFDNKVLLANEIYLEAITLFHSKKETQALELIDLAIILDSKCPDYYEVKGAILGQMNQFEDAIVIMDELLKVDENSVMAHTNKSLFLMKIGKIAEAEEEKALATVASFQSFGVEAKRKKEIEAIAQKENEEIERRRGLFLQVLAIDDMDDIANFGLADINFKHEKYDESLIYLEKVLSLKPKYSQALLLKGKVLEKLSRNEEAKLIYAEGIIVASKQGEMMPANEMQSRLNLLK